MRIVIDRELCMGHGRCAVIAPDLFQLDDLGYVVGETIDVPAGAEQSAEDGVDNCPEGCLSIDRS